MFEEVEPEIFLRLGNEMMGRHHKAAANTESRRFHATFGTSPFICALLWAMLEPCKVMPICVHPKHLLWALMFLKLYVSEHVNCAMAGGVDEKTYRKWTWLFINGIASLAESTVRHAVEYWRASYINLRSHRDFFFCSLIF
jgi:hypothetical protein